ncbi:MAG: hypothetical protein ABFS45_07175 [Pseudomonadota bacterium]
MNKIFFRGIVGSYAVCMLLCTFLLVLQGCGTTLSRTEERILDSQKDRDRVTVCTRFFSDLDLQVDRAGVGDAQQARIEGFPYLRVNRFLASYRNELRRNRGEFESWVDRLLELDYQARVIELTNLPQSYESREELAGMVRRCSALLRTKDMVDEARREYLMARATVAADYQIFKRVLGLYPITAQFVLMGVDRLHTEINQIFANPLNEMPVHGRRVSYVPKATVRGLSKPEIVRILREGSNNPLGIPLIKRRDRDRLFATFAPVWEIDVVSDSDRIGSLYWGDDPYPQLDTSLPRVYRHISHTRWGEHVYVQLNYQIWFPARPKAGAFDILGGHLDGITWRVTLDESGEPLVFDAMHNCGCYHMYFPSSRLHYKGKTIVFEEPLLVPARAPRLGQGQRMVLRIAHTTHYLEHLSSRSPPVEGVVYRLEDYRNLRSLPLPNGGHRSLFGPDGIVAGTQRAERWVLWPMGIPEPGAMRQWGHHATAFVGWRHFDDPDLLERYFDLVQ